jgi:hypothetical protein
MVWTIGLAMLACGASACRAHTQEIALDLAAKDFSDGGKDAICPFAKTNGTGASSSSSGGGGPSSSGDGPQSSSFAAAVDARAKLVPWIVGPNQFVIEGCDHQARYVCQSDSCRREGAIESLRPFVEVSASAAATARFAQAEARLVGESSSAPAAPTAATADAPADSADAEAVRATLEAHRSELASCVDKVPFGLKVDYAPGTPLAATLRGDLHGKPEESCVRNVLKGVGALPLKSAGLLIHVVK